MGDVFGGDALDGAQLFSGGFSNSFEAAEVLEEALAFDGADAGDGFNVTSEKGFFAPSAMKGDGFAMCGVAHALQKEE